MPEKKNIAPLLRSAAFEPSSFNEADGTVELVAATDTPILQRTWDGLVNEKLLMDPSNVRMDRLNAGASVLDNHDRYSSVQKSVVGVVQRAWLADGKLRVIIKFSNRADVAPLKQDVKDGIIRNVSIGYRVFQYRITENTDTPSLYEATDWEPSEVSFVGVPADYNAGVRSDGKEENEVQIIKNSKTTNMPDKKPVTQTTEETRSQEGGATPATVVNAPAKETTPVSEGEVRSTTIKAERVRSAEIFKAVRAAKLPAEYAEELVGDETVTLDGARAAILNKLADAQSTAQTRNINPGIVVNADETDRRRAGMRNGILVRAGVTTIKEDGKDVRVDAGEFRGMSLIDMAREAVELGGTKTRGLTHREIAQIALGINDNTRAANSTSDFPIVLGNTINRSLRSAYELAERTFMPFCRRGNAKDFRTMTKVQLGDLANIDAVAEGGEYKMGTLGEGGESYKVAKYGKIIPITWETLVNDDLDAFSRIPQTMANACAQKQSDLVYGILTGNPNMADGIAVFEAATHKNYTSAGTAISVASLTVGRKAIRQQKTPGGSFMNLIPKILLVGPDKEQEALQFLSANYVATKGADINVWAGSMQPIIEGRLTGNQWYMFANPATIDTIEYSFLDGEEIFTEQKIGFEVDGMQVKVRMVFGAKAIEHRGMYKNVGA